MEDNRTDNTTPKELLKGADHLSLYLNGTQELKKVNSGYGVGYEEPLTCSKDYYKILEVDYDATDETIRYNYRRLALKWHPDKHNGDNAITAKFQEINEAYRVLSDPAKRLDYDFTGVYEIEKYTLREYLARFKGMILTCNGLGLGQTTTWTQVTQPQTETIDLVDK